MGKVGKTVLTAGVTVGLMVALGPAGGSVGKFAALGLKGWTAAAAMTGVLAATSLVLGALGPKPKQGGTSIGRDYRRQVREAVVPARWIYGRARVAGVAVYITEYTDGQGGDTDSRDINTPIIDGKSVTYREGARRSSQRPTSGKGSGVSPTDRADECYEYRDVVSPKTGATHRQLTWGPCSASGQGASGQQSSYTPARTNQAQLKGTEGLFMVLALTEGAIDAIEKIWVDGAEMPFEESGGVINPTADEVDDVKFKQDGKTTIRMFLHRGEASGSALNARWGRTGVLQGVSAIGVELAQYEDKPWSQSPSLEFAVRGVRITWPGQTTPTWTENAAAVRYHYLTQAKNIPASYIDETRFRSAYTVCAQMVGGEPRYAINGVVSDDEDYDQVIKQMDFAWAGSAPEINGKMVFNPGAPGSVKKTWDQDDLVAGEDPAWQIETPIYQQADAVDAVIASDVDSDFLPYSMGRVGDSGLQAKITDLGSLLYVGHRKAADRLMNWQLKHLQQQRRARVHVVGGDDLSNWNVSCADRVVVNIPDEGVANTRFFVESIQYDPDGTLHCDLVEEPSDLYDHTATALPTYIQDHVFVPQFDEPTALKAEVKENPDGTHWDITVTCAESPNGDDLQVRHRYADADPWILDGTGSTLIGLRHGSIQIGARLVGRDLATGWTGDARLLRVTLQNRADASAGPRLSYSGAVEYVVGASVNIVISVTLEDNAETFTHTISNKPTWLSVAATRTSNTNVESITLTGTMVANTDANMTIEVTDAASRTASVTLRLKSIVTPLRISGVGDATIPQGVSRTIGTVTSDSPGAVTWSVSPAVSGVSITSGGALTARLSTLGAQSVTIKAVETAGQRRTATLTITLTVVAATQFGVEESNPVLLFRASGRLYMGGVDTDRIYRLDNSSYLADQAGATGMPDNWERCGSDGTWTVAYTPSGLRRITRFTTGGAIAHTGLTVSSGDSASRYRYLAVAGAKIYGVYAETLTTYRTETYSGAPVTRSTWDRGRSSRDPQATVCVDRSYTEAHKPYRRIPVFDCRTDTTTTPQLTRRVATTTTYLRLRVASLSGTGLGSATTHTIEQTTSSRSYSIHGVAVAGSNVYILMTRAGTKGIWRCTLTGGSFVKRRDRSESNPVDMAASASNLFILDRGADRVNRAAL